MRRLLATLAWLALGATAAAGLLLSAATAWGATAGGQAFLLGRLLDAVNGEIAGRASLDDFSAGRGEGIELRGLRLLDPRGRPVLEIDRVHADVDLSRLRSRRVSLRLAVDGLRLSLRSGADGGLNLLDAVAARHPAPPDARPAPFEWSIRVAHLALRRGEVRWADEGAGEGGSPRLEARDVEIDGRAIHGPAGSRADVELRAALVHPEARRITVAVRGSMIAGELLVPVLRAAAGDAAVDLVLEGKPAERRGRAVVTSLTLGRADAALLAAGAELGDLHARAFAESDGSLATASATARPGGGGAADLAAAARLPPGRLAAAAEVRLAALDPSRVSGLLPPGEITLQASGHAAAPDLATLAEARGALRLALAPSRLRGGRAGPAEVEASAGGGTFAVRRLEVALPGASVRGEGTWQPRGPVSGAAAVELPDVALFTRNLSALLGAPLPRLAGTAGAQVTLGGTAAAPTGRIRLTSRSLSGPGFAATGFSATAEAEGPRAAPRATLEASLARLHLDALDARALVVRGRVDGPAFEAHASGLLPEVAAEPFAVDASGQASRDWRTLTLAAGALAWPRVRLELEAPATLDAAGPRVDRLALRDGAQRIAVEGGLRRGLVEARVVVEGLDLASIPARLLPEGLGLGGRLALDARLEGKLAAPLVAAHAELRDGTLLGARGVAAAADLRWDGPSRRASGALEVREAAGPGSDLELRADLPVDLPRARPGAPVSAALRGSRLRIAELLRLAGTDLPLDGLAAVEATLRGTAGAPSGELRVSVADGRAGPLDRLSIDVAADLPGERAAVRLTGDWGAARTLEAEAGLPLDLAALLADPAPVLRGLQRAPLALEAHVPGVELGPLSRSGLLPAGLEGRAAADVALGGTALAPRGTVALRLAGFAAGGWRDLGLDATLRAEPARTSVEARLASGGQEAARLEGSLAAPPERLADGKALRAAGLRAELTATDLDLTRLHGPLAVSGRVDARVAARGTLAAPAVTLALRGEGLGLGEQRLGGLDASGEAGDRKLALRAALRADAGGTLDARLDADLPPDVGAPGALGASPARLRLDARALDLGFLPALLPGVIRESEGKAEAAIAAAGPLFRLRPQGTLRVAGGRLQVVGLGDWRDIAVEARGDEDALVLERLTARRGRGTLALRAEARGLARPGERATLSGRAEARDLLLSSDGQDVVTLDLEAALRGTFDAASLEAELEIPSGTARLPRTSPRALQSLAPREDVVVLGPERRGHAPLGPGFRTTLRVLLPGRFRLRGDFPAADVGLRGDVTLVAGEGKLQADGRVETTGGYLTYYGRLFQLKRGVLSFAGGDLAGGTADAEARYDNPAAKVTLALTGPIAAPTVKLTSEPPLDEGQIALLLITGRTETKANTGSVGLPTGTDAGYALLGSVATKALTDAMQNKLPVDMVSFDSSQIRMGKYVGEKVYVGYTRRFNANVDQGENANEFRVEYQVTPRWTLESRYGDANTGSASFIWSRDY